jgi:hypothetical protein
LLAKFPNWGSFDMFNRHATIFMTSTLDATTAHCLPPSSAIAPAFLTTVHLDI